MGNGKITKELKGLGLKINETEPNGETVSEVIKGIADDYEGGSGATYTAGNGIAITEENVINADLKVLEVSNITGLTTEQCEALNVGDVVIKLTSNQKHTYTVSYKEAGVGMCLTYVDASTSETVSYDYVDSAWVYNSTDITPLGGNDNNNTILSKIDLLKRTNGKEFNFTKFKAFLENLNVLNYIMDNNNDYISFSVSNANWGATTYIFNISVSSSGTDYNYTIETFDNNYQEFVGNNPLTIGDVLDKVIQDFGSSIVDNTSNNYINNAVDAYFSMASGDDLCVNYIKISHSNGMDFIMVEFNWEDFFACFDEVNND